LGGVRTFIDIASLTSSDLSVDIELGNRSLGRRVLVGAARKKRMTEAESWVCAARMGQEEVEMKTCGKGQTPQAVVAGYMRRDVFNVNVPMTK
jgi:hypothetical protein